MGRYDVPGHAQAAVFNSVVNASHRRLRFDTGISVSASGKDRFRERGIVSEHIAIVLDGK
jgi:hypothetical protein